MRLRNQEETLRKQSSNIITMDENDIDLPKVLKEQFDALPKPVQKAIFSSHLEEHLKKLADENKLHLDQWVGLENEVMMVLLGLRSIETLADYIRDETKVPQETAERLAQSISEEVFDPIREELERELSGQSAPPVEQSPNETARQQALTAARKEDDIVPITSEITTPTPTQPKTLGSDPYREPVQ